MTKVPRRSATAAFAIALLIVATSACGGSGADGPEGGSAKPPRGTQASSTTDACPTDGEPVRDIAYASAPGVDPKLLSVDVYPTSTACPAPVVVWVHGGGWRIGDKSNRVADKVHRFNELGYTFVSVNYRLTDPNAATPVQFPTHNEDVAAALAWVHANISQYGGDPDQILQGRSGTQIYLDAFGADPAVWADASPITHVAPGKQIPQHLLVRRGAAGRQRLLALYEAALTRAGVPFTTIDGLGLTHADVNNRIGAAGDTTMTPAVTSFLNECFRA